MGPVEINGLPAHVLLVHAVVILLPLTCLLLVAAAVRPPWLRRMGLGLPGLALVSLVLVPVTTHAGEWLEERVPESSLVERHADLGDGLLPWAVAVFVMAVLLWWAGRRSLSSSDAGTDEAPAAARYAVPLRIASLVVALVVAVGCCTQIYRIGDSGAQAVWHDGFSTTPR
ncbi:membrane protein [Streptomyces rimosus subsp. pseudoverticillatus]|uniref:DUF2231 domain-containing protein n=1 Tax=Streptomyces rimosus TaxID=1927 RepID=UPI0006B293DD|nr:DUF2231 domain-containing protein [Streptomyces rimosus]KOT90119.1 membrane protein [Streptomyces rimosus subsp. pseudoverticillatus]